MIRAHPAEPAWLRYASHRRTAAFETFSLETTRLASGFQVSIGHALSLAGRGPLAHPRSAAWAR